MKRRVGLLIFIISFALMSSNCNTRRAATPSLHPQTVVDIGVFYDELAPYGAWLSLEGFGWAWSPYGMPFGWRPYTDGYWVWTDYGWTWVSYWRWGWAPFHYGRWHHHHQHGWVWIPGTVWGPAWVAWRHGPGWVGWAPLPPDVGWRTGDGVRVSHSEIDRAIQPDWYSFVEERRLTSRELNRHILRSERNASLIRETQNRTNYVTVDNRVVNHSLDVESFEQATHQQVRRHRLVDGDNATGNDVSGDRVRLYRPAIEDRTPARPPRNVEPAKPEANAERLRHQENQQRRLERQQAEEKARLEKQQRKQRQQIERQRQENKHQRKQKPPTGGSAPPADQHALRNGEG